MADDGTVSAVAPPRQRVGAGTLAALAGLAALAAGIAAGGGRPATALWLLGASAAGALAACHLPGAGAARRLFAVLLLVAGLGALRSAQSMPAAPTPASLLWWAAAAGTRAAPDRLLLARVDGAPTSVAGVVRVPVVAISLWSGRWRQLQPTTAVALMGGGAGRGALPGDTLLLRAVVQLRPPPAGLQWGPGQDGLQLKVRDAVLLRRGPPSLARALASARAGYARILQRRLTPPAAALTLSVATGDHSLLSSAEREQLSLSGLIHIAVLSGLKVSLLTATVRAMLPPVAGAGWMALALTALYTAWAGATPPALRALLMAGLTFAAPWSGRKLAPGVGLAAAGAGLLLWQPSLISDSGFALSVLGTAGLVLGAGPCTRLLAPALGHRLGEPAALAMAAQLACAPLLVSLFGAVGWASPLANAVAVPLLPGYLLLALAFGLLGVIDPGAHSLLGTLGAAALEAASGLLWSLAAAAAQVPGLVWRGAWPPQLVAAYYCLLGAWWLPASSSIVEIV